MSLRSIYGAEFDKLDQQLSKNREQHSPEILQALKKICKGITGDSLEMVDEEYPADAQKFEQGVEWLRRNLLSATQILLLTGDQKFPDICVVDTWSADKNFPHLFPFAFDAREKIRFDSLYNSQLKQITYKSVYKKTQEPYVFNQKVLAEFNYQQLRSYLCNPEFICHHYVDQYVNESKYTDSMNIVRRAIAHCCGKHVDFPQWAGYWGLSNARELETVLEALYLNTNFNKNSDKYYVGSFIRQDRSMNDWNIVWILNEHGQRIVARNGKPYVMASDPKALSNSVNLNFKNFGVSAFDRDAVYRETSRHPLKPLLQEFGGYYGRNIPSS